jgi:hypothetical protein
MIKIALKKFYQSKKKVQPTPNLNLKSSGLNPYCKICNRYAAFQNAAIAYENATLTKNAVRYQTQFVHARTISEGRI